MVGKGRPRLGCSEQVETDRVKAGLRDVESSNRCESRRGVFGFHHT